MQQQSLILLAAFWAGTSAVFAGIKNAGELRDKLIIGKVGGDELPLPYLWRVFLWDWLPFKIALGVISLVLGAIIVMLPGLKTDREAQRFAFICYIAALLPFAGAAYQWGSCIAEAIGIVRRIREIAKERLAKPA